MKQTETIPTTNNRRIKYKGKWQWCENGNSKNVTSSVDKPSTGTTKQSVVLLREKCESTNKRKRSNSINQSNVKDKDNEKTKRPINGKKEKQ